MTFPPVEDLDEIIQISRFELEQLRDAHLVVYGGTGFVGKWLISTLSKANKDLNLNCQISLVTRNPEKARWEFPIRHFENVQLILSSELDLISMQTHVVFAASNATDSSMQNLQESFDLAQKAIDSAKNSGNTPNFVHLSSGAASKMEEKIENNFQTNLIESYAELKLAIEKLVEESSNSGSLTGSNPRLFAFYGPLLPTDSKYAIGNFMHDAMRGQPIRILGNPQTQRSYLYPSELISLLLVQIVRPSISRVDLGGSTTVTLLEVASLISSEYKRADIEIVGSKENIDIYLPNPDHNLRPGKAMDMALGISKWRKWLENY